MAKRKCSQWKNQRGSKRSAQKKQKEDYLTPERAVVEDGAEPKASASRRETPGRAAKRKADEMKSVGILSRQGTPRKRPAGKSAVTQQEANIHAIKSLTSSSKVIVKELNQSKMVLVLNRIEMDLGETLRQHGVTLPDHDLTMLHSLKKSKKNSEQSCITKISSVDPKPKSPTPLLSQARDQVVVLPETPVQALGKPKNETNDLNCQTTTEISIPPSVTHVTLQSDIGECKNKFLENLALTQIVPTRAIPNPSAKRILRLSPARKYSSPPKKKIGPPHKILPSVPNGKITTNNTSISTLNNATSVAPPNDQMSPENVRIVSKVRIIDLPAKDLQNLQNNKSHIQYMTTKKDPSPQEVSLLRKLLLHQKKILASGKVVVPIPGETVKGIPFLSGACMYVVRNSKGQVMPDTGQTSNKVVVPIPYIEKASPATGENRSNCSPNLPQAKHSATEKLLELATNNRCNYIFPDAEKTVCNHHSCVLQVALLKSEVNQKSIALESCNSELANVRAELGKANEYISNLRAQLEENTHTLCSYLAASSHVTYK